MKWQQVAIKKGSVFSPLLFDSDAGVKLWTEMPNWHGVSSEKFSWDEVSFTTDGESSSEEANSFSFWTPSVLLVFLSTVAICIENMNTSYDSRAAEPQEHVPTVVTGGKMDDNRGVVSHTLAGRDSEQWYEFSTSDEHFMPNSRRLQRVR